MPSGSNFQTCPSGFFLSCAWRLTTGSFYDGQARIRQTFTASPAEPVEFLCLLVIRIIRSNSPLHGALKLAEAVRKEIAALRVPSGSDEWVVSISVGVAASADQMSGFADLIKAADQGDHLAKHNGRNCVATSQQADFGLATATNALHARPEQRTNTSGSSHRQSAPKSDARCANQRTCTTSPSG